MGRTREVVLDLGLFSLIVGVATMVFYIGMYYKALANEHAQNRPCFCATK